MKTPEYNNTFSSLSKMTSKQLEALARRIRELEYDHYRSDDSPKGENVPGVRHR